ncbi:MAG: LysR family transcriptional regulator [Rhodovarius sp.]|nr:LysR family transcriptional regulator [Rhodovarius sp.]MCX7931688.1 LysR family transcriptional regulator [Rhodovarius sp.]MDW8313673.1 LysR family transcriptional regulator [Rhodovarius sp.]
MIVDISLREVEMVLRVAELGSISRAAGALNIVQPALSRHIQKIEAAFGAALFQRLPRGVRLTPAGQAFLEHGRRMLREWQRAREAIAEGRSAEGAVVLGLSPSVAPVLLPDLVDRLRAEAPGVRLAVREAFSPALFHALLQAEVDLAVLTNPPPARALSITPLVAEPIVLLSRPGTRPGQAKVGLAELQRLPVLISAGIRRIVEEQLIAHGARLAVDLEIDSLEAIRRMALRGGRTAMMPVSTFRPDLDTGALEASEVAGVHLHRLLVIAERAGRPPPNPAEAAVQRAIRHCVERLADAGSFAVPTAGRRAREAAPRRRRP